MGEGGCRETEILEEVGNDLMDLLFFLEDLDLRVYLDLLLHPVWKREIT